MKKIPALLFFALLTLSAQAQNNYAEAIQQGDAALRRGQYKTAINKYFAAEAFDPSKKAAVQGKVNKAFDAIEALRRQAEKALAKADKLINVFYFYNDQFALAYKFGWFYFIDKNGDEVTKLGKWNKAEQFNKHGFAKVTQDENVYLMDTLGNTYPVAYDIENLTPDITALDLSNNALDSIPSDVFLHRQLKILLLEDNILDSLPAEIGNLKNLTFLYLGDNPLSSLPAAIGSLTNLTVLELYHNFLQSLPAEIGGMKNLTRLELSGNHLLSLPAEIGRLEKLMILSLDFNLLTTLPSELGSLQNLVSLGLAENDLTNLPSQLGSLQNLMYLDLFNNPIPKSELQKIQQLLPNCQIEF